MRKDEHPSLSAVLHRITDLSPRLEMERLQLYIEELLSWNPTLGLISKHEPEVTAAKLIRLSVDLWDFFVKEADLTGEATPHRFIDIGSGGGFPGLIWKLLNPDLNAALVERKEKKAAFLERTVNRLGLDGVRVFAADARELVREETCREAFHIVVMLAVTSPEQLAVTAEALLGSPGFFCTVRSRHEKIIKDRIGQSMKLNQALTFDEGIFVLYEKPAL